MNKKRVAVAVIIAVIVIVSAFVVFDFHLFSKPHLGTVSLSEVKKLAGQSQQVAIRGNGTTVPLGYSGAIGALDITFYNNSPPYIDTLFVLSLQYPSQSSAHNFSTSQYQVMSFNKLSPTNSSYGGFSFFYTNVSNSIPAGVLETFVAIGVSGSYVFVIADLGYQFSSYTALIHDEIGAMGG